MTELQEIDYKIIDFTFEKPQVVVAVLKDSGYIMSNKITLDEIAEKTYKALIIDKNVNFANRLESAIENGGYNNVIPLVVGGAFSLATALIGAKQAKDAAKEMRETQERIALAQLQFSKLMSQEELRVAQEQGRLEILANSISSYRETLQGESTQRQKNVYLYLIGIGASFGIMYGTYLLLKK